MSNEKENIDKMNNFIAELDELLKKHGVTLYGTDMETGEETTYIYAFKNNVFDTGLSNNDYGGFH